LSVLKIYLELRRADFEFDFLFLLLTTRQMESILTVLCSLPANKFVVYFVDFDTENTAD
jgi:hypothetical protein